ncbi:histidinol-phosphate aminotransferase [Fulvimarina pelagi HTCC2506]|uniref:Histidinol-phosphate aminotransferase n=1 Tax=Fulvimarina pelagi HTCC2506 TaxID=314231 RepID=Q0G6W8_9HYPH|nr:aminotransferase class I/II-fold pyridoxal phosphate-dependent enzyme [Fulvimarina pelagi]EAU42596.1 histidinol-phosphate aminotransferase [Fulvimarina pelagi HTCC2506]
MTGLFDERIRALASESPFTGPETLERRNGQAFATRLGANESVFGPSPKTIEAMARVAADSWMYGDPEQFELREALAEKHGLAAKNIICGVGIDGLLRDLLSVACAPGSRVLTSLGAYPTFGYFATAAGAAIETVPYTADFRQNWQRLTERAQELRPKVLYLTNPDNPTGSYHDAGSLQTVLADVPDDTIVALDEAYCDFAPAEAIPPADLVRPNLLRFRTFSKAYGMAGARIGYVIGDPYAIAQFDKVRDHFAVTRLSQAGAIAALADVDHLKRTIAEVAKAREQLAQVAENLGFAALPSATNFVAIDLGKGGEDCRKIAEDIERRGVFVRRPATEFLNRTLRVTAGTATDIERFGKALRSAVNRLDS